MYPEKKEIVLFGINEKQLKPFVPEIKIRMNKGKAFDVDKVTFSSDAYRILKRIYGRNSIQENFVMLLFNRANKLIGYYKHTIGSSSATIVDIPMLIGLATKALAQGIVISHNHPSGTLIPSEPDKKLTKDISQALKTVKINLLDHLIYTNEGYYSFADEDALNGLNNTAMITIENIISEYPAINQSLLPTALKQSEFEFIAENIDLYNEDETIKKYIDTFVEKLNEVLSKSSNPKVPKYPKKEVKVTKSKYKEVFETPKPKANLTEIAVPVEKLNLEVSFIKRYVGLHGKTKDKAQILNLLNSLQKAIIEKRIRKTSPYVREIEKIQQQLIKCYNQMKNTIQVTLDEKTLEAYLAIAHSEKTMLSVMYIKQYIGIHGKKDVKDKAKALLSRIEKAIESGKIPETCPYWNEIREIKSSLESYLENKSKTPAISENTLNGIMSWMTGRYQKKKVDGYLPKAYQTERELQGVKEDLIEKEKTVKPDEIISSTELAKLNFKTIGFTGKWLHLIGDPSERFTAMFYGGPGCGKSTLAMEFAYYLAKDHGKMGLYIANEEKVSKTLQDKLKMVQGDHPNLNFVGVLRKDKFNEYDCIFIDSVNTLNVTPVDLERIAASHPGLSIIYICQTTKEGRYRGSREFEHFADVVIRVENGIARAEKNRFGGRKEINIFQPVTQVE